MPKPPSIPGFGLPLLKADARYLWGTDELPLEPELLDPVDPELLLPGELLPPVESLLPDELLPPKPSEPPVAVPLPDMPKYEKML